MNKLQHIRVCLAEDGTVEYWPHYEGADDLADPPLDPTIALQAITKGQVPIELACNDPGDDEPHNYETLFTNPDGSTQTVFTLTRI